MHSAWLTVAVPWVEFVRDKAPDGEVESTFQAAVQKRL